MGTMQSAGRTALAVSAAWLGLSCAGAAAAAQAGNGLPAATSSVQCNAANQPYTNDPADCTQGGSHAIIAAEPYVNLFAHAASNGGLAGNAFATLTYSFEVTGGTAGDIVPISIETNLFTQASYPNYAFAEIYTDGSGADAAGAMVCTDNSCPMGSAFDGTLNLDSVSGAVRTLTLYIGAEEGFGTQALGDSVARADPFIGVDPIGLNQETYSIEVSPGVANGLPGVPEPASWALMILGFGLAGAGLRGCRRAVA
jgi:hypothetical protein